LRTAKGCAGEGSGFQSIGREESGSEIGFLLSNFRSLARSISESTHYVPSGGCRYIPITPLHSWKSGEAKAGILLRRAFATLLRRIPEPFLW